MRPRPSFAKRCHRAVLEVLETRRLLAGIVVNTLDDETTANSTTSLREAIDLADTQAGDDVITFDATVFEAGSVHVITPLGEPLHITGAMGKVTITGPGTDTVAIDGSQSGRGFDIDAAANVVMSGMSLVNGIGAGVGGAIRNLGTLAASNIIFENNQVVASDHATDGNATLAGSDGGDLLGGAIYSTGSLNLTNCVFSANFAEGQGGGTAAAGAGDGGDGIGGAIYANGAFTITNCQFINNLAQGGQAGQRTDANANGVSGDGLGGAICLDPQASGTIINSTFTTNEALGGAGSTASGAHVAGSGANGFGGAIYSLASSLTIPGSTFNGNSAIGGTSGDAGVSGIGGNGGEARGGGIWSLGTTLNISNSTLTANNASAADSDPTSTAPFGNEALGGGLFIGGTISIVSSTIDHNEAFGGDASPGNSGGFAAGGGMYLLGSLQLLNSTVYANTANGGAGGDGALAAATVITQGIPVPLPGGNGGTALGGGINCDNVNALTVINSTIALNGVFGGAGGAASTPGTEGDAFGGGINGGDVMVLTNTIIGDNTTTGDGPDLATSAPITLINCLVTSSGGGVYTLTAESKNNITALSANLGPLINNGGPTLTAEPQTGSDAIDHGDNATAIATFGASGFDQRGTGFPRINTTVDIGAVETGGGGPIFNLLGNNLAIANGDTDPRTADNTAFGATKFGTPIDKTFTIKNTGTATLNLGFITLPFGFTVTKPFAGTVAPNGTTTFTVRFNPTLPGTQSGTVEISNNDGGHLSHFDFNLSATANGGTFRVNFQPTAAEVPLTYLADAGLIFGNRSNGYSYGWNAAITTGTRERNAVGDQPRDTLVHTQAFGVRTWEVTVPNGTYTVHVVAGDPSFTDSVYKFNVEGVLTVNGTPNVANHWVEGTKTVTVTDGKLTISNAPGAVNNKLDFVEITPVYKINFQTASAPVPTGYLADSGAVFGSRGNGLSYGWNQSASSFARDRNNALSQDQRYDTFIHTQAFGNRTWDLALANGLYSVHIVAGDPSFFDSVYKFSAEGTSVVSGTPTSSKHWIEGTAQVLVLDGKLTITNSSGAVNNKIAFIDVTAM